MMEWGRSSGLKVDAEGQVRGCMTQLFLICVITVLKCYLNYVVFKVTIFKCHLANFLKRKAYHRNLNFTQINKLQLIRLSIDVYCCTLG